MGERIDPVGSLGPRPAPIRRVERRQPAPEHHEREDREQQFADQLERGLRTRAVATEGEGDDHERGSLTPSPRRQPPAPPQDGRPHVDVRV